MSGAGSPVTAAWLALRRPADVSARHTGLAARLAQFLRHHPGAGPERPVRLVDVGAGTGAGAMWLRPLLPVPQEWRLVDRDAALLRVAPPLTEGWARPVVADLARLDRIVNEEPADVITCQALLDLLRPDELSALLLPAIDAHAAVLAGLSVTGEVRLDPAHPDDAMVAGAFNAHQRRDQRLGPGAWQRAVERLRRHGYVVTTAASPWRLGPRTAGLMDAWLIGRAAAAIEQDPDHGDRIARWLTARRTRLDRLRATVEHVDLLGLPPGHAG